MNLSRSSMTLLVSTALLLAACSTSVVSDEEKNLPESPPVKAPLERSIWNGSSSGSFIVFTGSKGEAVSHEGKFNDFVLVMDVVTNDPETIAVDINMDSLETDVPALTDHLKGADFFDVGSFPIASFRSTTLNRKDSTNYEVTGALTIRDNTEVITFDAVITQDYVSMKTEIDRNVFNVGLSDEESILAIDALVPIEATIYFEK